jgi:hypothetical protein
VLFAQKTLTIVARISPIRGHEGDRADLGEVDVGDRAPDGERPEHAGRDQKSREDRLARVELEDEREGDPDRRGVDQEEHSRQPDRDPIDQERDPEDDPELDDDDADDDPRRFRDVGEQLIV